MLTAFYSFTTATKDKQKISTNTLTLYLSLIHIQMCIRDRVTGCRSVTLCLSLLNALSLFAFVCASEYSICISYVGRLIFGYPSYIHYFMSGMIVSSCLNKYFFHIMCEKKISTTELYACDVKFRVKYLKICF